VRIPALALAERALVRDVRGPLSHVLRSVLVLFLLLELWAAHGTGSLIGAPGLQLFRQSLYANFFFITLMGISAFSPVIAEEKENMTLGVLKLAGFSGVSIVIGKSVGQLLRMLLLVVVQLPFALLAITLGGVSRQQVFDGWVILMAHLLFVYALSLLASVVAPRASVAARISASVLLCYYLLPLVGVWLSSPGSRAAGILYEVCDAARKSSALAGLEATFITGYPTPAGCSPLMLTVGIAVGLLLLTGLLYGPCTRTEAASAPWRGFGSWLHGGARRPGRPGTNAVFWKDYQFHCGGGIGTALRLAACGSLVFLLRLVCEPHEIWWRALMLLFLIAVLDLAIQAARMFRAEIEGRTLPMLMLLPKGYQEWAFEKAVACLTVLLPPALWGLLVVMLAPAASGMYFGEGVLAAMYLLPLAAFGAHLVVWLSLLVRHGAVALAICMLGLGMGLSGLLAYEPFCVLCGVPLLLVAGALVLQGAIGRLVAERAGE